ncbi:MAG: HAMP domain-containing histidine kinase [Deltaproteobacteria bacterium]|nr:HAMP domain-containing histidine kinase [Deltaproteobacteria bacterium]
MPRRLLLAMIVLFLAPVLMLAVVAIRAVNTEQKIIETRFATLSKNRLIDLRARVTTLLITRARQLEKFSITDTLKPEELRSLTRNITFVTQLLLVNKNGTIIYPSPNAAQTNAEKEFLQRTAQLWKARDSFIRPSDIATEVNQRSGWYTWYWENGLEVMYWRRLNNQTIVAFEISRPRLLADIIATLPVRQNQESVSNGCTRLTDSRGQALYQWGECLETDAKQPFVDIALDEPLEALRLQYFTAANFTSSILTSSQLAMFAGITAVVFTIALLGVYVFRENTKTLRQARTRVSFVNQVSHELKTPLTNIRMYAEMLLSRLEDDPEVDPNNEHYLRVVVSESQRLTRLIANVLTFAQRERKELTLHRSVQVLDQVIANVIEQFAPALVQKQMNIRFDSGAPTPALFDADAVAQITANLINNAEKYARAGGEVLITTQQHKAQLRISVIDRGEGIAKEHAHKIFAPFTRLSNKVTEGVSGTGIGLTIAQALARLHGGDLKLIPSDIGAHFEVTLHAPEVQT